MSEKLDLVYTDLRKPEKDRFPRIVLVIILAEFCERFSYSGMRAFLTLYMRSKLNYTDDEATEIYHIFSTFVYVFPIIGGILADNYLGKFRTILYLMFVYAVGNILVAVTAIPQLELPTRLYTLVGLSMITLGTGGIKPCVTAFGGDQFKLPEQERYLERYFSILYFILCLGSLIAKTVSPILRSEVHCFGDKDCYSLAFGAPGGIIIVAIVIFVSVKGKLVMKQPEGNVVFDFIKCVTLGWKNAIFSRKRYQHCSHWLDTTEGTFDKNFIVDVKKTVSILRVLLTLPVFFSLLDQMGSRWTLQATKMDGRFGFITIKPDQMQVICPIFILGIIVITQKLVYPFFERRKILTNPLHKLTLGGVLAGVAFIVAAVVEIYLQTTYPRLPEAGLSQLRIFNGNPCAVAIRCDAENITYEIPALSHYVKKDLETNVKRNVTFEFTGSCIGRKEAVLELRERTAISYFMYDRGVSYVDNVEKSRTGFPVMRFLVADSARGDNITLFNEYSGEVEVLIDAGVSQLNAVFASTYSLRVNNEVIHGDINIESGGVYTLVISKNFKGYISNVVTVTAANSITMALLIPQFLIISTAEVFFAITGNEFAFKESPESMKAVMAASWLMVEAFGNVIIIVITRIFKNYTQAFQFLFYAALMYVTLVLYHFVAKSYPLNKDMASRKVRSNSDALYLQVKTAEDCLDH